MFLLCYGMYVISLYIYFFIISSAISVYLYVTPFGFWTHLTAFQKRFGVLCVFSPFLLSLRFTPPLSPNTFCALLSSFWKRDHEKHTLLLASSCHMCIFYSSFLKWGRPLLSSTTYCQIMIKLIRLCESVVVLYGSVKLTTLIKLLLM